MSDGFKSGARVSIECKDCGKRTTVPALMVAPGVKCQRCGKVLAIDDTAHAAKRALLTVAGHWNNVDFG